MGVKNQSQKKPRAHPLHLVCTSEVIKKRRGGGSLITNPAVFSEDSEYIFLNTGWGLKVYSLKTGDCVKVLEAAEIKCEKLLTLCIFREQLLIFTLSKTGKNELISCSVNNFGKNISKKKINIPKKFKCNIGVSALIVPNYKDRTSQDLCIIAKNKSNKHIVLFYNINTGELIEHPLNGKVVGFSDKKQLLSFGGLPDEKLMATIIEGRGLNVYSLDGKKHQLELSSGRDVQWTTVSCHPTEPSVAAGDSIGRCCLFRNPLLNRKVKTIYHWHTLPCDVISFSPAGSTMYTGGREHVLVKWNLENPNVKNFLPRLSAPIVHITVSRDNSHLAVSTLDNGIVIVDSTNHVKATLQNLVWGVLPHPEAVLFPASLSFYPSSRSVVLNSRPGHLQFYCPETEVLTSVDISQQNYLTQERNKAIVNTDVTRLAFSSDSAWMATVETRQECNVSLELKLKLWQYQISLKRWILNSVVDLPHSGPVDCLRFRSVSTFDSADTDYLLVSTGQDGKFRLWSPVPIDSVYKKGVVWKCENAASYKNRKVGPACFSEDGSLLAVAFEHILTLWSSDGAVFKTSLSLYPPHIKQVEFGRMRCSHLLVAASDTDISVWNLLTLSVSWTANVAPTILFSDPLSPFMAVISNNTKKLYVFHPSCEATCHEETALCNSDVNILGATFAPREIDNFQAPNWLQKSIIYYIDSNQELHSIETDDKHKSGAAHLSVDKEKPTLFADLKRVQSNQVDGDKSTYDPVMRQYGVVGATAVSEFLRAPCHTMAPVSSLCASLLEAFSLSKSPLKEHSRNLAMDVDEQSDEGLGNESDSSDDENETKKKNEDFVSKTMSPKLPTEKSKSDDLFFIDLDVEVDNIINN